ncbi:MAG: NADH-quinone oxidoreductase subunit L [Elusimicrobia bacterium]|nr:NADH-quinone oxidoreductase subunit L [Elusimicrobiota bacterium]
MNLILIPIALPLASAFLILLISEQTRYLKETLALAVSAVCLLGAFLIFTSALFGQPLELIARWAGYGMDFALKADRLSSFILLAVSLFTFLTAIYSFSFEKKGGAKWFYFNLLQSQAFAAGAALSDNLVALLFFWEGLLIFLTVFIALSKPDQAAKKTAMKAFLINAAAGLCLLAGVAITAYIAGSMSISGISADKLTLIGWAAFGYVLMLIGAVSKSGAFPFHTWLPDAALDSSAPFMAYAPAALDKLLGIYFLARISVSLFTLNGTMQLVLMTLGALTILVAAMMALAQTDYKRLLSYLAVSQAGYLILAVGTLNPAGLAGGLFHMLNSAVCLSCLFMTAGAVERRTGAGDLSKLGGLFGAMPVTALCFIISAAALSGIAPLNGFFSIGLIYEGVLSAGYTPFFITAALGSALTLASFLKLGHAVFFGNRPEGLRETKEAPFSGVFPMAILAAICVISGFGARLPLEFLIAPGLRDLGLAYEALGGLRLYPLFWVSVVVILTAVVNHMFGCAAAQGKACKACDHILYAPVLRDLYALAQARFFDPYEQFMKHLPRLAGILYKADRFFDYLTDDLPAFAVNAFSKASQRFHTGYYPLYLALTIAGFVIYIFFTAHYGGLK